MVCSEHPVQKAFVTTIKEQCRVCYTCVRECPAKAIRISYGQAKVIGERCIGCGNCVRVCSQKAKQVISTVGEVEQLLRSGQRVVACLAPSFPAEFVEMDHRRLVGMVRALGFKLVNEVAFGADLVAREYRRLMARADGKRYIATTCPAIIGFIERYHPNLVGALAPIVSPMVATARALHELHGSDLRVVFIGPCIAKKGESNSIHLPDGEIDVALTFVELRQMFESRELDPDSVEPSEFDPPRAGAGALFPISRGLLQAAQLHEDLISGDVIAADGRSNFVDAIREFEAGALDAHLLEVLCCNGCIMGAGMSTQSPLFSRRSRVSQYVRKQMAEQDSVHWRQELAHFEDLDMSRHFGVNDQRIPVPSEDELSAILSRMGKTQPEDELNCGACGYDTCREHAVAIYKGLAESEMCLPYTIEQLRTTVNDLDESHRKLASAREALMQSEKMAGMGQLAAGVAHEVNNPLGVILMYSHILLEEAENDSAFSEDLRMIAEQADRCKKIVGGLLNFARENRVVLESIDVRDLIDRSLKAVQPPENVHVVVKHQQGEPFVQLDLDQMTQVLINLITNAYAAMPEEGTLTVRTTHDDRTIDIIVSDTGVGISRENIGKIFDPFYTTKPMGQGTGLGLAVTYGIVKMHRGDIRVKSNADPGAGPTGTTFTITLPRQSESG